jgi:hypothetical protein
MNLGHLRHRQACCQLWIHCNKALYEAHSLRVLRVKKVKDKIVYYKETVECQHVIFLPQCHRRAQCHTAELEPNWRVTVDWAPLLVQCLILSQIQRNKAHCA